ncbi:hypothetical protein RRF57_008968 [Xylaria bambusicola]|uniref:Uncharacterized protein n=1 Tax=Xylaria bambusicola TaxID=326684 RepID=A0AAN7UYT5_9PEZI
MRAFNGVTARKPPIVTAQISRNEARISVPLRSTPCSTRESVSWTTVTLKSGLTAALPFPQLTLVSSTNMPAYPLSLACSRAISSSAGTIVAKTASYIGPDASGDPAVSTTMPTPYSSTRAIWD